MISNRLQIIQFLIAPDNSTWQGKMLGLANDGAIYSAENDVWVEFFPNTFMQPDSKRTSAGGSDGLPNV
jgi:hypothetical protein